MFYSTFQSWTSETAAIPADLFGTTNAIASANTSYMFYSTFQSWTSETAAIPAGLFANINTSASANTSYMFYSTFQSWSIDPNVVIPSNFFANISTAASTNLTNMYYLTFSNSFVRKATFYVNGVSVQTPWTTTAANAIYQINDTTAGTTNISQPGAAGHVVAVAYNTTARAVPAPNAPYNNYQWFNTDGTTCTSAPSPNPSPTTTAVNTTSNCGPQTTPITFASTQWTAATDPMTGNMSLYGVPLTTLTLTTSDPINHQVHIIAHPGAITTDISTLNINTNSVHGYSAYLTMDSTDGIGVPGSGAGDPTGVSTDQNLHSGAASLAPTANALNDVNTWGARGGLIANYTGVPLNGTSFNFANATAPTVSTGTNTTLTFGANTNSTTPSGSYVGDVLYTVVTNP
jgi:hypothetical protein